jgi:hypothetical protein
MLLLLLLAAVAAEVDALIMIVTQPITGLG